MAKSKQPNMSIVDNPNMLLSMQQMVSSQLVRDRAYQDRKQTNVGSLLVVGAGNQPVISKPSAKPHVSTGIQRIDVLNTALQSTIVEESAHIPSEMLKPQSLTPWHAPPETSPSVKFIPRKKIHRSRRLPTLSHLQPGRGLVRSVNILKLDELGNEVPFNPSPASDINDQLVHDVSVAFKQMFAGRHQQQVADEAKAVVSRIKTPPLLVDDDLTAYRSKQMFNDILDDFSVSNFSVNSSSQKSLGSRSAALLSEFQAGYQQELTSFSSIALFVEARYLEMKEREQDCGNWPTQAKAALMGDLALTLSKALGRYAHLMEPILWELLNCIFVDFAAVETRIPGEKLVSCLTEMPTFFDRYYETQSALDDANGELGILHKGNSMREMVKKFQTIRMAFDQSSGFVRDACFKMWKKYTLYWRKVRNRARLQSLKYRISCWKLFQQQEHLKALEEYVADIDKKLIKVLQFHDESQKKSRSGVSPKAVPKVTMPTDEKSSTMRKYLQRLSRYVSDSIQPLQYAMEDSVNQLAGQIAANNRSSFASTNYFIPGQIPFQPSVRGLPTIPDQSSVRSLTSVREQSLDADEHSCPGTPPSPVAELPSKGLSRGPSSSKLSRGASSRSMSSLSRGMSSMDVSHLLSDSAPVGQLKRDSSVSRWHQLKMDANLCQEQMTQTPDEWMAEVPEPAFSPEEIAFRRSKNVAIGEINMSVGRRDAGNEESDKAKEDADPNAKGANKYNLSLEVAHHLIAFIYESKMIEGCKDISVLEFSKNDPFLEYIKELLNKRYRIRRLANKFFRGLMSACLRDGSHHRRLELFGQLCGLSLVHQVGHQYDHKRCTFFFAVLRTIFEENMDLLVECFNSTSIPRQMVIDKLPTIFHAVEKYDADLYEAILFEIIDLPCVDPDKIDVEYKVNVDEALSVIMEYYDVELEERDAHKLKMRKEQEAAAHLAKQSKRPRQGERVAYHV